MLSQIIISTNQTAIHTHLLAHLTQQYPQLKLTHLKSPDILHINTQNESLKISQVRELTSELNIKPTNLPIKIAILYHAHQLTIPAQNALLKTLEEPPPYAHLFLITNNQLALLPTINSRCLTTTLHDITLPAIAELQLTELINLSPISRLQYTNNFKTREHALLLLSQLLSQAHLLLRTTPNTIPSQTLKTLLTTQKNLLANTHVQLTLDHCFLNL